METIIFFPLMKERGYCYGRSRVGEVRYSIGYIGLCVISLLLSSRSVLQKN